MCEIQRFYVFPKKGLEKALELIGALDHDKTFRFCFFFLARRNQYTNVGKMFLFLKLIHIKFDNT